MKLFKSNVFHVIFLVPVAMAASNGGCSQTVEPGPLTAEATQQLIVGNTVTAKDSKAVAFVAPDGTLRGRDLKSGGTVGTWRISANGVLCAEWTDAPGSPENCDTMNYLGNTDYEWGDQKLGVVEGNPNKL